MYRETIGLIGGFGAYATLDFYRRFLEVFAADCERDYPHIYMDNNFTMPSRTKALLYGDDYSEVVEGIAESLKKMCNQNVDYIILVCGTAHAFLPDAFKIVPEAETKVVNLIKCLADYLNEHACEKALIIAAEGTLKQRVYEKSVYSNIHLINPGENHYGQIREFIEAVKQNKITYETYQKWIKFIEIFGCRDIILGCTEFPVLIEKLRQWDSESLLDKNVYHDPLEIVLKYLKKTIK